MNRFPFIIHYVELTDAIWVVAFAHTSAGLVIGFGGCKVDPLLRFDP